MRLARLILITIFILSILAAPSFAATKTITYTHTIPSAKTDWNNTHTLPLFNPALGKLIRVDFNETLNATMKGWAENLGLSIARAFLSDDTTMYALLLNGDRIDLAASMRYPTTGTKSLPAFDGIIDYAGVDSFNIAMNKYDFSGVITYTLPEHAQYYD